MEACRRRPTESSFRQMADLPKLATSRKVDADEWDDGLTERLKRPATSLSKLAPGSKHRSESPAMEDSWISSGRHRQRGVEGGSAGREGRAVGEPCCL